MSEVLSDGWKVEAEPENFGLAMLLETEAKGGRCTVSVTKNKKISILSQINHDAQNITITNGKVVTNDAKYDDKYSSAIFEKYFISAAQQLPKEVKKLFGGNFNIN